jgi:histidine ammonia-lyase
LTTIELSGSGLTVQDAVRAVKTPGAQIIVTEDARARMRAARAVIDRAVAAGQPVYGVNTGFGRLQNTAVPSADLFALQRNLVLSHACGVGPSFSPEESRLMLLLRIQVMLRGNSGVTMDLLDRLLAIWNAGLAPVVPQQGSVGASGDLAPLAHLALPVIGEGHVDLDGERLAARVGLERVGLPVSYQLKEKEGLALLNGTQTMTAVGLLAVARAERLLRHADLAAAMTIDGLLYTATPFQERIQAVRGHPGQFITAANVRRLLTGSEVLGSHPGGHKVQDAYSVRCAPQVHGAARDVIHHVRDVLEREANATTDNPLVFPEDDDVVSGGNFHGEPVAMACDYLKIGAAELASISERRIESLVNPDLSHLPAFLSPEPGVNSGFMMAQVTAAALISENKVLAHPASVDSVPTSANQEDHVSMGPIAARHARDIIANCERVLVIELLAAAQALHLRRPLKSGHGVEAAIAVLRDHVPPLADDRLMADDFGVVHELMRDEALLDAAAEVGCPIVGLVK